MPFAGFGPKVVTNQYNSPSGLYSSDNIRDLDSAVDAVQTMTVSGEPSRSVLQTRRFGLLLDPFGYV